MAGQFLKPAVAGVFLMALIGCDDGQNAGSDGFRRDYTSARSALETGNYDKSNRIYARMMQEAGPLRDRIQLEYAHSLLRSGTYDQAATQAQALSQRQSGTARSAALAVLGTAYHELGLTAMTGGDTTKGRQYLTQAQSVFAEVLKNDPELDPLGAIAGRQASITVQLKAQS